MPLLALIVLFVGVPVLEIFVVVKVAEALGVVTTLGLMLADAIAGSMLMRSQGRVAWRRFTEALAAGRVPGREVLDGGLIIFGGALLMAPGFVTDILGALLLAPPTRALARRLLARRIGHGLVVGTFAATAAGRRSRRPGGGATGSDGAGEYDVDGTAVEVPSRPLSP